MGKSGYSVKQVCVDNPTEETMAASLEEDDRLTVVHADTSGWFVYND